MLNLHLLRIFAAVAETLSFSRAAEVMYISQPAVSKAVIELESQVGQPLIERGGRKVRLTEAGARDPLFCRFPERFPVFQWHGDTFDVPEGGVLLALGELCHNQAFRSGKVVGLQFHLEVSPAEAAVWAQAYTGELAESGKTAHRVAAECAATALEEQRLAALLMHNFLETLRAGEAKRAVSGRCGIPPA